ncbi:MAG: carboxypeptidase regulatory-like domain-containing protein, partial [Phycisphaerae bacterium]|nr:carboxypeptidase regulatory-like domain-containing protein [Saprospiraceae bacterium]
AAVLEGHLYRSDDKPSWGGTVRLYPNGPIVKTNQQGFFSFKNVDLARYTHLQYGKIKYHRVFNYGSHIVLRLPRKPTEGEFRFYTRPGNHGSTVLTGKVTDHWKEDLIGATIKVMKGQDFVRGSITDYNGDYRLQLDPGVYDVEISYTGFRSQRINGLRMLSGRMSNLDVGMSSSTALEEVEIVAYRIPLIEQDNTSSGQTLTSDQIRNLPTRSINTIVATTVGASSIDGGDVNIKGARSNGTDYYIDGIRVTGSVPPVQDLEQLRVLTGRLHTQPIGRQFSPVRAFYVPKYASKNEPPVRNDFRSTIYWNPKVITNKKGQAEVRFFTSDAITNFRATLEGIGAKAEVGHAEQKFFAQKPLSIAVKTPAFVIVGDLLRLQIALTNKTNYPAGGHLNLVLPKHFSPKIALAPKGGENIQLAPGETKTITAEYSIGHPENEDQAVKIQFCADEAILDAFETTIRTYDRGFPAQLMVSGSAAQNVFNIQLSEPVEGTVEATLTAYPSALEEVLKGMERMLSQPSGCFEQVSSSNYPNLLVLNMLRTTGAIRPEVESRAQNLLEDGYRQLTAYECKSGGFDWWGRDPGHEGLTAYGLLEFTDMARVFPVDKSLIDRTSAWLRSRRDGKGGWAMNPNNGDDWQNDSILGAYIAWAVAEAGEGQQFKTEIEHAYHIAAKSEDPYIIALLANALAAMRDPRADNLVAKLLQKQAGEGAWMGTTHSVFGGEGDALRIETTALAALAMMRTGKNETVVERAMQFIAKSKNEYGYGNTQSTVLALKALVEYAKSPKPTTTDDGTLVVQIDGKRVHEQSFSKGQTNRVEIKGLEQFFSNDHPRIEVFFERENASIPFDLEIKYATRTPINAPNCPISFKTALGNKAAAVGETVRLSATLKNETSATKACPMVIIGIPAGLTLQPWQLKKLVDEKQCDFYELWDGFAVFHFERLAPNESRQLNLDLRADVAGSFEAPASRAFLYYQNEQCVWSKPERLDIRL